MSDLVKLKMLTSLGGPDVQLVKGDPHSCDNVAEALRLVEAGFAVADGADAEAALSAERERVAAEAQDAADAADEPAAAAADESVPAAKKKG